MEKRKILGSRLRAAREATGLSQANVAELIGVTRQSVCAWENGARCPTAVQLGELAAMYCVCAHSLLFGESFQPLKIDVLMIGR